jgi:hypothetical protein
LRCEYFRFGHHAAQVCRALDGGLDGWACLCDPAAPCRASWIQRGLTLLSSRRIVTGVGRGFRETGQALERMGARAQDNWLFQEKLCRHRALMNLYDQRPKLSAGVFVAPNASVIGSVEIKDCSSVWYGAVVRGDQSSIHIGGFSSIGDRTVIQVRPACSPALPSVPLALGPPPSHAERRSPLSKPSVRPTLMAVGGDQPHGLLGSHIHRRPRHDRPGLPPARMHGGRCVRDRRRVYHPGGRACRQGRDA